MRIVEGDEPKTNCMRRYGRFEFLVMSIGLFNALATFFTLVNNVLWLFLEKFVAMYLDNIVVFSKMMEEHKKHLAKVFKALRENQLYLKWSMCIYG